MTRNFLNLGVCALCCLNFLYAKNASLVIPKPNCRLVLTQSPNNHEGIFENYADPLREGSRMQLLGGELKSLIEDLAYYKRVLRHLSPGSPLESKLVYMRIVGNSLIIRTSLDFKYADRTSGALQIRERVIDASPESIQTEINGIKVQIEDQQRAILGQAQQTLLRAYNAYIKDSNPKARIAVGMPGTIANLENLLSYSRELAYALDVFEISYTLEWSNERKERIIVLNNRGYNKFVRESTMDYKLWREDRDRGLSFPKEFNFIPRNSVF